MPIEYTYFVFGLCAAFISFVVVRIQIKFAHFFYVFTQGNEDRYSTEVKNEDDKLEKFNRNINKVLRMFLYINFIFPVIIVLVFINPLTKSLLVPDLISDSSFTIIKILLVLIASTCRVSSFREELQFQFNESYYLVQRLMIDKNAQIFKYIQLRMQENWLSTWYYIF